MVSSRQAADAPPVSDFVPNPTNHDRIYGRNRIRNSSKLAESCGTKTSSLTHSHTEKFKSVKLGDRGGQNLVSLRPIQATTVD